MGLEGQSGATDTPSSNVVKSSLSARIPHNAIQTRAIQILHQERLMSPNLRTAKCRTYHGILTNNQILCNRLGPLPFLPPPIIFTIHTHNRLFCTMLPTLNDQSRQLSPLDAPRIQPFRILFDMETSPRIMSINHR